MHVAEQSGNPGVGERIIDRLVAVMEKLAEFPTMGRARFEVRPRLRSFASPPFVIYYRRKRSGIDIIRILHQRQSVKKAFPKRPQRPPR